MFRPLFRSLSITLAVPVLALAACSPDNLATAGDSSRPVAITPMADPTLPAPAVEALGPVCAAADPAMVAQIQEQLNAERVALGRSPLNFPENLTFAAQAHACDMATMGRATVAGSNGSSVVHRVRAVEYSACSSAQLIGRAGSAYGQMSTWMGHEPDQEVLVHQKFDDAGVGVVNMGGRMWWSVPEGVDSFDTWRELTTVYHEGVPGHHLQIAQAVYNRAELNSWRRLLAGSSGHAEGWALYAERLMEQLGYLDDPADRLGMLDGQRMRAARVVLDIGVHLGKPRPDGQGIWDADVALEFMRRNVNMSDEFIQFEVNRYLGWPGQAPSYKVGQRIWEQIRDETAEREGDAFDIKRFHMRALRLGGVGLDTLRMALAQG